jgi:molecular chaperone HtpG
VRLTGRLKGSAAVLVADEGEMTAHMERLMQRLGRGAEFAPAKKILEVNPDNPAVKAMQQLLARGGQEGRLEAYGRLLYDQAVIAEGSKLPNPQAFAQRISEIVARDAAAG